MEKTISEKIEGLIKQATINNSFITEPVQRHLRNAHAELNSGKPDLSFVDTQLEAAYSAMHKDRDVIYNHTQVDPKESDSAFKELSEALEVLNECIEQVTNEY